MILVLSWTFLRCRYRLTHIGGMALGLMSVVVLVWVDIDDGKGGISSGGKNILKKYAEIQHFVGKNRNSMNKFFLIMGTI